MKIDFDVSPVPMTRAEMLAESRRLKQAAAAGRAVYSVYDISVADFVEQLSYMNRWDFWKWRPYKPLFRAGPHRHCERCALERC